MVCVTLKKSSAGAVPDTSPLVERLRTLEQEKAALLEENGNQRRRYERCLTDVTNHVMHVLLAQKVSKYASSVVRRHLRCIVAN